MTAPRLVIDALAARFGGTAYAAVQTAQHLAQSDSFDEVVVVTRQGSIVADGLPSGGRLRVLALRPASTGELVRRLAWEALALRREAEGGRPALVLTWSGMLPRRLRAPVTSFLSNALMFERNSPANQLRRRAVRWTARGDTRIVAPTVALATMASEALGVQVAVVPLGVDHSQFSPAVEPGEEVLCVADFYGHKRHDIVLDAWAAIPTPRPTLRLVGDPRVDVTVYRQVRGRIERYRALGTVELESHLRPTDVVAAYRRARAFVIASEHESFCMPLLEALTCGVPAVARDLPALRETGGSGTRFVSGDDAGRWAAELHALLSDDHAHEVARTRGLGHADKFDWIRTAAELRKSLLGRDSSDFAGADPRRTCPDRFGR